MTAALKRLGFDVETLLDPNRSALKAAVRRYGDRSANADVSLFYYSGHALEAAAHNWLLPAPARLANERDLIRDCAIFDRAGLALSHQPCRLEMLGQPLYG
jgi:uncharacterized caspase-like protein